MKPFLLTISAVLIFLLATADFASAQNRYWRGYRGRTTVAAPGFRMYQQYSPYGSQRVIRAPFTRVILDDRGGVRVDAPGAHIDTRDNYRYYRRPYWRY